MEIPIRLRELIQEIPGKFFLKLYAKMGRDFLFNKIYLSKKFYKSLYNLKKKRVMSLVIMLIELKKESLCGLLF
jgi:hypothetical protein